ncbi:fumarylacetoacetate hydrolase family protein [Nocardia goodfellowii]|uniref:Acylpyruvate hydrolase n=1 Tax=Nocardia goodfellowii TaxID=882446 RepID=A0ABS4QL69_9NOCA|nr:fumarylacetoacetate hydrolase family protein [Nocardia goodfellowii]MBP2192453.1 acylpyruvate hydrolase [Nocardia goodfellowii]
MTYATYEHDGRRHVGELRGSSLVPLAGMTELGAGTTPELLRAAVRDTTAAVSVTEARILPVVPRPGKVFCVGLNYREHVTESRRELPTYPVLFPKFADSLLGGFDDIVLPPESAQVDYEGELVVVIGRSGRRIPEEDALDHVLGYSVANDVTMRDYQYKTHQWMQGKAWDASTPVGPYLVPPDTVDLAEAGIRTVLNGAKVQESDLSMLIFSIPRLIATISTFTALAPGDLILTGTPGGVGYRRDPQVFLTDGDTISVEIDGVGAIRNTVRTTESRA